MSIDLQKKIRFIPVFNGVTLFFFIARCRRCAISVISIWKTILCFYIPSCIFLIASYLLCDKFVPNNSANTILWYVSLYLCMCLMAHICVRAQQKMNCQNDQREMPSNEGVR